jgi:hypothetical protein
MMKPTLSILLSLTLCASAFAKNKDTNPADYPLTAHVIQSGMNPSYDLVTVEFQAGNLVYVTGFACRHKVQVGADVRVRVEDRKIHVLAADGQTCSTHIQAILEVR